MSNCEPGSQFRIVNQTALHPVSRISTLFCSHVLNSPVKKTGLVTCVDYDLKTPVRKPVFVDRLPKPGWCLLELFHKQGNDLPVFRCVQYLLLDLIRRLLHALVF
jgi:hypothetical protein